LQSVIKISGAILDLEQMIIFATFQNKNDITSISTYRIRDTRYVAQCTWHFCLRQAFNVGMKYHSICCF